jgi:AcrR family transcriptional regulator
MTAAQRTADLNEETRQHILDAAFERFGHYGYNKTTMAEIARDAGMSAANLYRYFENKQEIAAACASLCISERIDLLRQAARQPQLTAAQRLHNYAKTMLYHSHKVFSEDNRINEIVAFVTNERADLVHQKIAAQRALIAEILAYGNETGEFDVRDVIATAQAVHAALVLFDVPLFMSLYPLQEFEEKANAVVKLLIQGLEKH